MVRSIMGLGCGGVRARGRGRGEGGSSIRCRRRYRRIMFSLVLGMRSEGCYDGRHVSIFGVTKHCMGGV